MSLLTWICREILFETMIITHRMTPKNSWMGIGQTFDGRSTCIPPQIIILMSLEITSMHIHMITLKVHRYLTGLTERILLLRWRKWDPRCPHKCGLRKRTNPSCRNYLRDSTRSSLALRSILLVLVLCVFVHVFCLCFAMFVFCPKNNSLIAPCFCVSSLLAECFVLDPFIPLFFLFQIYVVHHKHAIWSDENFYLTSLVAKEIVFEL